MIKRPPFVDYSFGSANTPSGRYLGDLRAGVEVGRGIYTIPISNHFDYLNALARIPHGSVVLLDFEPWTSQGPAIGDYADTPYDEPVIAAYNQRYGAMLSLVAPIARARQLRCGVYSYPATYRQSGNTWIAPSADRVAFQRAILDKCEADGLLDFFRTPEFHVAIPAYISSHGSWETFNAPGDTSFQSLLSNLAATLRDYEVGYSMLLQIKVQANQIWNPVQQKANYKHAAQLGYQWQRNADGSLDYRNVPQMLLWEEGNAPDPTGQTASVAQEIISELAPDGTPYRLQTPAPDTTNRPATSALSLQSEAAIYLPMQDRHDQVLLYPPKLTQPAGIQTRVTAAQVSVRGPAKLRAIGTNGTDQAWETAWPDTLVGASAFSGSICFCRNGAPGSTCNVATAWRQGRCVYRLRVTTSGNVQLQIAGNLVGNIVATHDVAKNVCDGKWHWIQWRMTGGRMSIWIDGEVLANAVASRSALTLPSNSPGSTIGGSYDGTSSLSVYSAFEACHFGLWNRAISDKEFTMIRGLAEVQR